MNFMKTLVALLLLCPSVLATYKPLLVLLSTDGFWYGYQRKVPTPNIDRIKTQGIEATEGLIPVFPTMSFPNHQSIITGLYPIWHGIVANAFRDAKGNAFKGKDLDPNWWLGEPIWQTVVNHGLKGATISWPGSQVQKNGWTCPSQLCVAFNDSISSEERVDYLLTLTDLPLSDRPDFIALHFQEPDRTGHQVGPDGSETLSSVAYVDQAIGRLLDGLEERKLVEYTTLIVVGDHGMVATDESKNLYLEDLAPWGINITFDWVDIKGPLLTIRPPSSLNIKDVFTNITSALDSKHVKNGAHLKVYLKEDVPQRLYFSNSDRIAPIVGIPEEGYKVELTRSDAKATLGIHGYDNAYPSMRGIFVAQGPRFKKNTKVDSFVNVEIYNLMLSILGIHGAPNNGTVGFVKSILL